MFGEGDRETMSETDEKKGAGGLGAKRGAMISGFRIQRTVEAGEYRLEDIFADIRGCGPLSSVFDDAGEIEEVIGSTRVLVVDRPHEMFVSNDDASITIGLAHLRHAPDEFLYLDILHELCHVKQQREGRNLYDRSKSYVDRETEVEAYRVTVDEARRLGMTDGAISRYLRVSWISDEEHLRLARSLGVRMDPRETGGESGGV